MTLWKLTDREGRTHGDPLKPTPLQWGLDVEHTAPGGGPLCTAAWIHAYTDPLLAVFLDPIGANFGSNARLWEAEGDVGAEDHGLKVGCTRVKTLREVPLPVVTLEQRVRFGILCARAVYQDPAWNAWADNWLSGKDRSVAAAYRAAARAAAAARVVAAAAQEAASAAWVVSRAAAYAAAAAWAASRAAARLAPLDLPALARRAMNVTALIGEGA